MSDNGHRTLEQIRAGYGPEVTQAIRSFEAKVQASESALTPVEKEAEKEGRRLLRNMLWAMFPRKDSVSISAEEDSISDELASKLIAGLRVAGVGLVLK